MKIRVGKAVQLKTYRPMNKTVYVWSINFEMQWELYEHVVVPTMKHGVGSYGQEQQLGTDKMDVIEMSIHDVEKNAIETVGARCIRERKKMI